MRPAEIVHRLTELATIRRLQGEHGHVHPRLPTVLSFCSSEQAVLPDLPWDLAGIHSGAEALLAGRWPVLGHDWCFQESPDLWRLAPDTGRLWPPEFFSRIDYRAGNGHGDIRVAWEPARLQQLVSLALLSRHADVPVALRAARLIEAELLSFVEANPPWLGIHYVSAMECALRLMAVCHALDLARVHLRDRQAVWTAAACLVATHASFIARRLSLHSSAGNHTVAECAGLIYAGTLFPELPEAEAWRSRGIELLASELHRQVLPDGGSLEQAPWYLLMITDLAGLVVALLDHHQGGVPDPLRRAVARGRNFLGAFAQEPAGVPSTGDRDDGYALSPALRLSFAPDADASPVLTFPATGCTRLRMAGREVLFDHGPLGMPPSFGHGHADALSVCLRTNQGQLLLDPGTYSYTGEPEWRRYFRSTAAHNTVTVDHLDQAVQETAFMWRHPFRSALVRCESGEGIHCLLARHDGYRRLPGNVVHWRGLVLGDGGSLLVWDFVDGAGAHHVELRWHLSPGAVDVGDYWLLDDHTILAIDRDGRGECLTLDAPDDGWVSPAYGVRHQAPVARAVRTGVLPCEFITRVYARDLPGESERMNKGLESLRAWALVP